MKRKVPGQLVVAAIILLGGGALVGTEYLLVKWYPGHEQRVNQETLNLVPYSNAALGIDLQVAAGIYGKIEEFPGGVKIRRPKFWGIGPSLTLTSQPNPDKASAFTPEVLAKWQTQGAYEQIPRYHFEHTTINSRDAVLIWQIKGRAMVLTARVISPDRLIEAACTPGALDDEALFMQACEASVRTLKVTGSEPAPTLTPRVQELATP